MNPKDKELKVYFRNIFGFRIRHLDIFRTALTHRSVSGSSSVAGRINNERLEYLGDAVLDSIMADFLFHKYPLETEGGLTMMRSKLVNRDRLNALARKIGLDAMMHIDGHIHSAAANGNAFEAVIGAIYLDQGYKATSRILLRLYRLHLDIDAIYKEEDDYKSKIINWAQHRHHKIAFSNTPAPGSPDKLYLSTVMLDNSEIGRGLGYSVKKAEQTAAEDAWTNLHA